MNRRNFAALCIHAVPHRRSRCDGFTMSLLERSTYVPLTHRTSEAWRAEGNRQVKEACSDFLFFEHRQDARTRIPAVESSAGALRPGTPIFATILLVFFLGDWSESFLGSVA